MRKRRDPELGQPGAVLVDQAEFAAAGDRLGAVGRAQLAQQVADVLLDRVRRTDGFMVSSLRINLGHSGSSRRTETMTRPRSHTRFSSPCRAAWSATGPEMTVWL